jgi:hypothetical protein
MADNTSAALRWRARSFNEDARAFFAKSGLKPFNEKLWNL